MTLTKEEIQAIEREAQIVFPNGTGDSHFDYLQGLRREAYIAAATAYAERAKGLVEAAQSVCKSLKPILPESILSGIYETLQTALNNYNNGK